MKIDLQIDNNDDLEYFKVIFPRNVNGDQIVYNFHADHILVRIQVIGEGEYQLATIGIFSVIREGKTTSSEQFCPLADSRFENSDIVRRLWGWNQPWGSIQFKPDEADVAFESIRELLYVVYQAKS